MVAAREVLPTPPLPATAMMVVPAARLSDASSMLFPLFCLPESFFWRVFRLFWILKGFNDCRGFFCFRQEKTIRMYI
jgi:hypothetical protein